MFRITTDIYIDAFKPVKPNAVQWSRDIDNFTDTATVKLPAIAMLKKNGDQYEKVQTGLQFTEGMHVSVQAGYDGHNNLVFKGFISRINFTIPLEVECEGYAYQLRKKLNFSKSYKNTTVKNILSDLVAGTDIVLSKDIPDIPLDKATFINVSGTDVLQWFKEKCLLTVYFDLETLYVGMMQVVPAKVVKYRLGWNVIKDNELKFNNNKEFAEVRFAVEKRSKDGTKKQAFVGKKDGQVKVLKSAIDDEGTRQKIAEQVRSNFVNQGYEGMITTFLKPFINVGDAASIDDLKYPQRIGKHFVSAVSGSITPSGGGRLKVKIANSL